jgi:hypothetical protein
MPSPVVKTEKGRVTMEGWLDSVALFLLILGVVGAVRVYILTYVKDWEWEGRTKNEMVREL